MASRIPQTRAGGTGISIVQFGARHPMRLGPHPQALSLAPSRSLGHKAALAQGHRMRLALAQLNFTVGAFDANFAKIDAAVARARAANAGRIRFSETATTGAPPPDPPNPPPAID